MAASQIKSTYLILQTVRDTDTGKFIGFKPTSYMVYGTPEEAILEAKYCGFRNPVLEEFHKTAS